MSFGNAQKLISGSNENVPLVTILFNNSTNEKNMEDKERDSLPKSREKICNLSLTLTILCTEPLLWKFFLRLWFFSKHCIRQDHDKSGRM